MQVRILLLALLFSAVGCGELFYNRSFVDEMEKESDGIFVAGRDFEVVPGDNGRDYRSRKEILERTPASAKQSKQARFHRSIEEELNDKLSSLSEEEYQEYNRAKEHFTTPYEKIYYLNLPKQERNFYMNTLGPKPVVEDDTAYAPAHEGISLLEMRNHKEGELFIGMDKSAVIDAWGKPEQVETAGNPGFENERWSFYKNGQLKQVFFESGKVQGWALK